MKRKGKANFFLGKWAASLSDFKEAVSLDSMDKESQKEANTLQAIVAGVSAVQGHLKSQEWQSAHDKTIQLVSRAGDNDQLAMLQIECYVRVGKVDLASSKLSALGEECTNQLEYYYLKALVEYFQGNTAQTKKLLAEVLRRDPDQLQCQQLMKQVRKVEKFKEQGNELLKQSKLDEAIE